MKYIEVNKLKKAIQNRKKQYDAIADYAHSVGDNECFSVNVNNANVCANILADIEKLEKEE